MKNGSNGHERVKWITITYFIAKLFRNESGVARGSNFSPEF